MGINEPVLNLAFVSEASANNGDLHNIMRDISRRLTCIAPQDALRECGTSCEHALIVVDGYALGIEALTLCRRFRLAGLTQPIVLAWIHHTDLDRAACREYGVDEIIFRPFVMGKVLSTVLSLASNWQPRVEGVADDHGRKHAGDDGLFGTGFAGVPVPALGSGVLVPPLGSGVLGGSGGRTELRTT